jgi:hypothetical protein
MVEITKAYPNPVNIESLMKSVRDVYPEASQGDNGFRVHNIAPENETAVSAALDVIIAAHNTNTLTTEQQALAVQANAKTQAAAIPNWATWTEAQALAWHDTNITNAIPVANLAAANVVLDKLATENRALVRMVIALRNKLYPDLQE